MPRIRRRNRATPRRRSTRRRCSSAGPSPISSSSSAGRCIGYSQPCGCSSPQYGGLARRWEFLKTLTAKGWTLIPVDIGEITPTTTSVPAKQNMLKYETAMRALAGLGYHAVGLGRDEFATGLNELLPEFALNNERPKHVALNLDGNPPKIFRDLGVAPYHVIEAGKAPESRRRRRRRRQGGRRVQGQRAAQVRLGRERVARRPYGAEKEDAVQRRLVPGAGGRSGEVRRLVRPGARQEPGHRPGARRAAPSPRPGAARGAAARSPAARSSSPSATRASTSASWACGARGRATSTSTRWSPWGRSSSPRRATRSCRSWRSTPRRCTSAISRPVPARAAQDAAGLARQDDRGEVRRL